MDYIQLLVVHSRGVYNFMGIILEGQVSFFFFRFHAFFSKFIFRFWPFSNPTVVELEETLEKALNANACVRWIDAFVANLGHPLWGSQSMQELASLMRKGRTFLIPFIIWNLHGDSYDEYKKWHKWDFALPHKTWHNSWFSNAKWFKRQQKVQLFPFDMVPNTHTFCTKFIKIVQTENNFSRYYLEKLFSVCTIFIQTLYRVFL